MLQTDAKAFAASKKVFVEYRVVGNHELELHPQYPGSATQKSVKRSCRSIPGSYDTSSISLAFLVIASGSMSTALRLPLRT